MQLAQLLHVTGSISLVHLHGLQTHGAVLHAAAAADAGIHRCRLCSGLAQEDQAGGGLSGGVAQVLHSGAHHGTAGNHLTQLALDARKIDDVLIGSAHGDNDVLGLCTGIAVHGDGALDHRHTGSQILAKGGDAGHVHDDGPGICGQTAVGHFAAQTLFNKDQLCAGAVDTGQGLDLDGAVAIGLFAQQVDALGLVVLNADDALRDAGVLQHGLDAADDIIAAVQHLLRIAGQPHFALGSVDQQGIHLLLGLQLYVGREACAAQTDQAALTHSLEEAGLIGHFRCLDSRVHGLFAIGLDDDRVAHAAIGQTEGLHCGNRAGDTGVDVCRDEAASLADLCANEHLVALFDQSFGGSADMLAHEDAYLRGQRHRDRFACSSCLVMRRMRAKRRTFQLVQHGIQIPHSA